MFEDMTYEVLNQRMIQRVTDYFPDVDIREGSIVFQSIAAAAMELSLVYEALDTVLNESFVGTASREYLLQACEQIGIDIAEFDATNGLFSTNFSETVPLGSKWNSGMYNYTIYEQIGSENDQFQYSAYCDTPGSGPNYGVGVLTPVDYVNGTYEVAELTGCIIPGEDESTDEEIRAVYSTHISSLGSDGNIAQYEEWCEETTGVGNYKIVPLWDGPNTVKVLILDADNNVASQDLVNTMQEYLDPNISGMGDGVAPIGAIVTVGTAREKEIDITANVSLKEGYTSTIDIDTAIGEYLQEIAFKRDNVPYMSIGSAIISAECVDFVTDLTVNGGTDDVQLSTEEIPVTGNIVWTVV